MTSPDLIPIERSDPPALEMARIEYDRCPTELGAELVAKLEREEMKGGR